MSTKKLNFKIKSLDSGYVLDQDGHLSAKLDSMGVLEDLNLIIISGLIDGEGLRKMVNTMTISVEISVDPPEIT